MNRGRDNLSRSPKGKNAKQNYCLNNLLPVQNDSILQSIKIMVH